MNATYAIAMGLLFVALWSINRNKEQMAQIIRRKKTRRLAVDMSDLLQEYLGKECIIYTFNTQVSGVIESVHEGWLNVKSATGNEMINLEFVCRIREYPRSKNGKKKAIFS